MEVLKEIRERFTVRSFADQPLADDILERILEAGRLAPSAKNRQAWRFIAVRRKDLKEKLTENCYGDQRILRAGAIVAACTTNVTYRMPNGQDSYPMDLAFAVSSMALQANHEGLGSMITSTFMESEIKDLLTVPYAMRIGLLIALGYSDDEKPSVPNRLPMNRICSYEHW